ncbi:hypothetical protein GGR54DRAFT_644618 [Hypoxylon sp. NC1633]|nr:hypothetical protein GGR54DRAFT_644618 [Hypoxylon sp. NC1633]
MKSSILSFTGALALVLGVNGAPTSETARDLSQVAALKEAAVTARGTEARDVEKRAQHCVYVCTNTDFQGLCQNQCAQAGICYNEPDSFNDQISAIGPDSGYCRAFFDKDCQLSSGHFDFTSPGISDLRRYGDGSANDKISSWMCSDS